MMLRNCPGETGETMQDVPREEMVAQVDELIRELLEAAAVKAPPVDAIALAQDHLDMVICMDERQPQRGRAQRALGKKQIFLKPEAREERHQWTVAHEIGEHLKVELLGRLNISPDEARAMTGESLANLFAHRLLTPTNWFADDSRGLRFDLLALKQRYSTASHEVLAWRWLDLAEPCVVTILDQGAIQKRRSNAWRVPRKLLPLEQACHAQCQETCAPATLAAEITVQCWPVHEADWKREILRTTGLEEGYSAAE